MKHLSFKEAQYKVSKDSKATGIIRGSNINPDFIYLAFSGPLADIPSLKNQKIRNTNLLRPKAKAHLSLMTTAVQHIFKARVPSFELKQKVFVLMLFSYRGNFDEDNGLSTIRDWLEPSFIRKKDRGWGVGIVENDKQINAFAIKKPKNDSSSKITEIFIIKDEMIASERLNFINKIKGMM